MELSPDTFLHWTHKRTEHLHGQLTELDSYSLPPQETNCISTQIPQLCESGIPRYKRQRLASALQNPQKRSTLKSRASSHWREATAFVTTSPWLVSLAKQTPVGSTATWRVLNIDWWVLWTCYQFSTKERKFRLHSLSDLLYVMIKGQKKKQNPKKPSWNSIV